MTDDPHLNAEVLLHMRGAKRDLRIFQIAQDNIVPGRERNRGQGDIEPHRGVINEGDLCRRHVEQARAFLAGLPRGLAKGAVIGLVPLLCRPLTQ